MPYFAFTDGPGTIDVPDTFVVIIDDPAKVAHARALIAGDTQDSARIGGRVTVAPAEHNIGWSYRIDPANIVFYDVSAEVYDAAMSAVEAFIRTGRDLQELLPNYMWLSWSTTLTAELNEVAGGSGSETLDGTALPDILFGRAGNDLLRGRDGNDHLVGSSGADRLLGGLGMDKLSGGDGNDRHDGGAGADVMAGGNGHDLYFVDDAGDRVIEKAGGGVDSVSSSVGYALPDHVEKLVLTGGAGVGRGNSSSNSLTGNAGGNLLSGGGAGDVIDGGAGNDRLYGEGGGDNLTGGAGLDRFLFNSAPGPGNVDRILDFSVADDTIWLARYAFAGLGPNGTLAPGAFRQGGAAADADDRILYEPATGRISFDADGSGAGAAILFAIVTPGTALTHADFVIYG